MEEASLKRIIEMPEYPPHTTALDDKRTALVKYICDTPSLSLRDVELYLRYHGSHIWLIAKPVCDCVKNTPGARVTRHITTTVVDTSNEEFGYRLEILFTTGGKNIAFEEVVDHYGITTYLGSMYPGGMGAEINWMRLMNTGFVVANTDMTTVFSRCVCFPIGPKK